MTEEVAVTDSGAAVVETGPVPDGVILEPTGLVLEREIEIDEWLRLTEQFLNIDGSLPWWIGDLLNYGEAAYGEKYAQAVDLTGRAPGTLAIWLYVARRYPHEQRLASVPWWAYQEIASLDSAERAQWIEAMDREGWTREQLRRAIRETPTGDSPPRQSPLQPKPEPIEPKKPVTPEPDRWIKWIISVQVPETADLMKVEQEIRKASMALEVILESMHAAPQIGVAVDVSPDA